MAAPVAHPATARFGEHPAAARFAGHGSAGASRPVYRRHEAEKTVLYQIVSRELETLLAEVRDHYEKPLPAYVEKELRDFMDCGILARGFVTAVCESCGQKLLVALSCKKRGICPSCGCRRMCNAAAHLADHVVPDIPVRQWVMSAPFELRFLLASRADAFTALTNIFIHQAFRWQRERARALGMAEVQSGALVTQHRFGSSLNLHTHLHAVLPDGVFSRPDPAGRAQFDVLPGPTPDDLRDIAFNVHQCFRRWLKNHGLLGSETEDDFSNETPERSALGACTQSSLRLGELVTAQVNAQDCQHREPDEEAFERRGRNPLVGESHGYNLFAGDAIPAGCHSARERLFRYCLRPQLSLERLSIARDGRIVYQVKATRRGKATQRIMAPLDFMARLVALIPPPFHPLLRYFGVFAPHSAWRAAVVPENHEDAAKESEHARGHDIGETEKEDSVPSAAGSDAARPDAAPSPSGDQRSSGAITTTNGNERSARLETGGSAEPPRRRPRWYIDWATLLRRVYDVDALQCACGGRLKFRQVVTEPEVARSILRSMGLPEDPPPIPKARSPTFEPDPPPADWD